MFGWFSFFGQSGYMPHGHCYLWQPPLVITHVVSDALIGIAYVAIAIMLYLLVRSIRLPFTPLFIAFGLFIGACGLTHFMNVWNLWYADYWVSGFVKVITAIASVATGLALIPVRPKIIAVADAAKLSEERRIKLESTYTELEALYEKVKESDVLKTRFFANVSHELRTPLALILGPVEEVMAEGNLSESQQQKLDVVLRNSKTLLKQVNDLLDVSKLEAGRMKPTYSETDAVKLFRFVAAHFETVMQSKGIFFTLHAPDSIPLQADPEKIQRIYMNLLSNAVKFVPEGGRIRASVQADGDLAVIAIEDTGPGVAPEVRNFIFERFHQGEAGADRKFGGTGLGLAITKDFVEMHGGTIELVSDKAPGAAFVVRLPLKAPGGISIKPATVQIEDLSSGNLEGSIEELKLRENPQGANFEEGRPTVLICEDNPDMNQFISDTLAREFNIARAMDGREGLDKARVLHPDLIVSDIMMPNLSGDQLVRELKNDEYLRDTPILLLSARADDEMRLRLLREGASDYLVKPFSAEELRVRSKNLLSIKITRDILEKELTMRSEDISGMAIELASQKRELQVAYDVTQVAREQAEAANKAKSAFLNLVSHEMNTPLSAMQMTLQLLQKHAMKASEDEHKELLDHLLGSCKHMGNLIEGLLEYIETGDGTPTSKEDVDLDELISSILIEFEPVAKKQNLQLRKTMSTEALSLHTDPEKLRNIMMNLIVNALKFTSEGYVELGTLSEGGHLVLYCRDTGPGISDEDQKRIFDPFEQIEPLERKTIPGIGLGLTLVKHLVEALDGRIEIDSTRGKGSTFRAVFPR